MDKWYSCFIAGVVVTLFSFRAGIAQDQNEEYDDRFSEVRELIQNEELILIWSEGEDDTQHFISQSIYDLDPTNNNSSERLVPGPVQTDSVVTGNRQIAVQSGKFFDEGIGHFVAAWPGPDRSVTTWFPFHSTFALFGLREKTMRF